MIDKENIKFAGQVTVDEVTIITSNGFVQTITNQVIGIQLFEDIFSPFLSGNIIVYDSLDLTSLFPFIGEEFIRLKIHTPSFKGKGNVIDGKFYVYKLSDREMYNESTAVYRLHFTSVEAIVDINKKISRSFEGKVSDIVEKVAKEQFGLQTDKTVNVEPTPNGIKFVSNYWSPVHIIKYCADRATNQKNSPSFVFFENRNGLNFVSLDSLYAAPVVYEFTYDNYKRTINPDGSSYIDAGNDYKGILNISIPEGFDYMSSVSSGMYASKLISYDVVTKKYAVKNFDMLTDFNKNNHLNTYPIASRKSIRKNNSNIFYSPKSYGNFNNFGDVTDTNVLQKRISLLRQLDNFRVQITVPGRTDMTVGQKCNITLFKNQPITKEESNDDLIDKVFSGVYIISAINHFIDREYHECVIEVIKESLLMDLDKGK